jgi:hypothetical protein
MPPRLDSRGEEERGDGVIKRVVESVQRVVVQTRVS